LDEDVQMIINGTEKIAREVVVKMIKNGTSIPAYAATLSYFDALTTENMPSNLIQAQRDYFGAHTYELKGKEGNFHTDWNKTDLP
jgi:6-phosphogluconate dehydrogenase